MKDPKIWARNMGGRWFTNALRWQIFWTRFAYLCCKGWISFSPANGVNEPMYITSAAYLSLVAYGSGKRMVTGTRAGSRIQTRNFKRRFLPHHKSQRGDIWCTNSPVVSCFNPKFVDRSVPYEAKQRRVKFRRCFGNIPLAECNVSVPNVRSSGTEPKAPVTDYRNRGSGNHTRG